MWTKGIVWAATGTSLGLLAESVATPLDGWGNLTALGILAIVVIFLVTKMLPGLHAQITELTKHAETENTMRTRIFTDTITNMAKQFHDDTMTAQATIAQLAERPCPRGQGKE